MSPIRRDIIAALERERARIEFPDEKERSRLLILEEMLDKLHDESRACLMSIEHERRPWEIRI